MTIQNFGKKLCSLLVGGSLGFVVGAIVGFVIHLISLLLFAAQKLIALGRYLVNIVSNIPSRAKNASQQKDRLWHEKLFIWISRELIILPYSGELLIGTSINMLIKITLGTMNTVVESASLGGTVGYSVLDRCWDYGVDVVKYNGETPVKSLAAPENHVEREQDSIYYREITMPLKLIKSNTREFDTENSLECTF